MDLLNEQRRFSLTYDGKPLEQHDIQIDAKDDSTFVLTAEQLESEGFTLTIPEKHTAKLFFYDIMS